MTRNDPQTPKNGNKNIVLKICSILDNFGAGEGFSMKIDNTDANKIPPSFFGMFFLGLF